MTETTERRPAQTSSWWQRRPLAWERKGFRQLARAWVFTNLADSALYLMVAVWVKDLTGSDSAAALVFVMLGVPALAAPVLGQVADRVSRRRLLVTAYLLTAAVVASLLVVPITSGQTGALWMLYAVVLAYGCVGYITAAAQGGLVRDLLSDEQLASGNGLLSTIDQSLRLLSPLFGAALYAWLGPRAVVLLTVSCFTIAAFLLLRLRLQESPPETADQRGSYWHEVTAGVRHLRRTPPLGRITILLALGFGATGLLNAATFPALEQGLGLPASVLGALVSVQGVGAIAGGMSAAWMIRRTDERTTFRIGMTALGLGVLPIAWHSLTLAVLGLMAVGFGVTWCVVAFATLRQRLTAPRMQGRVGAAANVAVNLPQTVVTATAAAALAIVDYRVLLVLTTVIVLAAALAAAAPRAEISSTTEPA